MSDHYQKGLIKDHAMTGWIIEGLKPIIATGKVSVRGAEVLKFLLERERQDAKAFEDELDQMGVEIYSEAEIVGTHYGFEESEQS